MISCKRTIGTVYKMGKPESGTAMPLIMKSAGMAPYLVPSEYVDYTDPAVAENGSSSP